MSKDKEVKVVCINTFRKEKKIVSIEEAEEKKREEALQRILKNAEKLDW